MPPRRPTPAVTLALPASFASDTPHLREKTAKIGLIGRAAAIFRVAEILIFPDRPDQDQASEAALVHLLLSYLETPQYLRRHLFPLQPALRYVGVLPPLRTPHHPLRRRAAELQVGDFREGVVVQSTPARALIDVGVERLAVLPGHQLAPMSRVTTQIRGVTDGVPEVDVATREEINIYWGFGVSVSNLTLGRLIRRGHYDLVILTSRHGQPVHEVLDEVAARWRAARRVVVAFGSPREGLREILRCEQIRLHDVADVVVNTIPHQGTETVRTEEAVSATLAILNLIQGRWETMNHG
jgi:predicted SPOUT superfamily RNA methylase MTH1